MSSPFSAQARQLNDLIESRQARVGVVGLGYVGLPLVHAFVHAGFRTIGFDVDEKKIAKLSRGESYIGHLSSAMIADWVARRAFEPTADMARIAEVDAVLICVPTPLTETRDPDLRFVRDTAMHIGSALRPGQLVVLESTTYPGTTRDVVLPVLAKNGLRVGEDFFLAYSPEREDPGNPQFAASGIPKVIGGIDVDSLELADALYRQAVVRTVRVSSCDAAEACKLLENTYRAVNIALVNELKILFDRMGLDVWEIIEAAKTKPFGFQAFYPGPGLGGHCIPIDPFYLSWLARRYEQPTRFIELAGEINTHMPAYVIDKVIEALNDHGKPVRGSQICILGVAYKKNVDDPRESPAFVLLEGLLARGAVLSYSDPHVPHLPRMRKHQLPAMESAALTPEFLMAQDCVLIVTDHDAVDYEHVVRHARLVVDTRNATRNIRHSREKIRRA